MRWYLPTWNGDIRAEQSGEKTKLTIIEPTVDELMTLGRLEHQLRDEGWWTQDSPLWLSVKDKRRKAAKRQEVLVDAPLEKLAPLLIENFKPGEQTLTAVVYRDGQVETVDGTEGQEALAVVAEKAGAKGEKAATVKRATPCCPQCMPGAVEPATEVLLDFLDEEQHASWAQERRIVVRGGISGHRYLLAHRHSETAIAMGRPCMDLDDRIVLHFHDQSVPPEEEVLGAMLVLEHREPWLRNEATVLGPGVTEQGTRDFKCVPSCVFDNPFGDYLDGVPDAQLTQALGGFFAGIAAAAGIDDPDLERVLGESVQEVLDLATESTRVPDDQEFLALAKQLGRINPDSLAELALYYKRGGAGETVADAP